MLDAGDIEACSFASYDHGIALTGDVAEPVTSTLFVVWDGRLILRRATGGEWRRGESREGPYKTLIWVVQDYTLGM